MKITHLSTYGVAGGAARAAYRLHQGLRAAGEESLFFSLYKSVDDPTVLQFEPPRGPLSRIRRGLRRRLLEQSGQEIRNRAASATEFTDDRSQHGADVLAQLPASDVLNLHWVAAFFDQRVFFHRLAPGLPVVWTLHDMNAFTGGCHYDAGCGKFSAHCGACPQLASSRDNDLSAEIWRRKREAHSFLCARPFRLVAPSQWLALQARRSSLLRGFEVAVIPYGIDLEHFQPRDGREARQRYGIPLDARTVLFVVDSAVEKRKGLHILLEAVQGLESVENLLLVAIGKSMPGQLLPGRSKRIDFVNDETTLSHVYSLADVFVLPSLQDNLPNTAIEAQACAVPAVASDAGGIPEIVRHGETGIIVPSGDPRSLRDALAALLAAPERRAAMAKEARRVALESHSLELQAQRYRELYGALSGSTARSA